MKETISNATVYLMLKNQLGFSPFIIIGLIAAVLIIIMAGLNHSLFTPSLVPSPTPEAIADYIPPSPSPTPIPDTDDETRIGWKVYTNAESPYQISYPASWTQGGFYNHYDYDDDLVRYFKKNGHKEDLGYGTLSGEVQLSVGQIKKSDYRSPYLFEKFGTDLASPIGSSWTDKTNSAIKKVANTTILNAPAVKYSFENHYEGSVYGVLYHFIIDDTLLSINFFAGEQTDLNAQQSTINQILESFQYNATMSASTH